MSRRAAAIQIQIRYLPVVAYLLRRDSERCRILAHQLDTDVLLIWVRIYHRYLLPLPGEGISADERYATGFCAVSLAHHPERQVCIAVDGSQERAEIHNDIDKETRIKTVRTLRSSVRICKTRF